MELKTLHRMRSRLHCVRQVPQHSNPGCSLLSRVGVRFQLVAHLTAATSGRCDGQVLASSKRRVSISEVYLVMLFYLSPRQRYVPPQAGYPSTRLVPVVPVAIRSLTLLLRAVPIANECSPDLLVSPRYHRFQIGSARCRASVRCVGQSLWLT